MAQLQRTLGPILIWGLGVGGPYGMLAATIYAMIVAGCGLLFIPCVSPERRATFSS